MRKRDYIALLEGQLVDEQDRADENGEEAFALRRERDELRWQLQRIRIAHEPLHEAIHPSVITGRNGG